MARSKILPSAELTESDRKEMFTLFAEYYTDVSYEQFTQDLAEKTHVFVFKDTQGWVGFSTILRKKIPEIAPGYFLFSGDTVIRKDYWGSKILQSTFFWMILWTKLRSPFQPVYWMLISKGYKTYMMMRKNFQHSFPSPKQKTPEIFERVMRLFYKKKFGESYNPETGVIRFDTPHGAVKGAIAETRGVTPESAEFADVQHFLKLNPDYKNGTELACVAEIRFRDFFFHIPKYFIPKWLYRDPRVPVLIFLTTYLSLGLTVLGFNRSPTQVLITCISACALEVLLGWVFKKRLEWPFSALITSIGLSILLNYSHDYFLLLVPVFFAIASKYIFTYEGKHFYNPSLIAIVFSLFFSNELITIAPAYQWYGVSHMAIFIFFPALMWIMPSINRLPLVGSFLGMYTVCTIARAIIMRHHLPFNTIFWGTLSSPSFLLFTFFMITDPKTSPSNRRQQIKLGITLAIVDLGFHVFRSYYTFFYAAFTIGTIRLLYLHIGAARKEGLTEYFNRHLLGSGYYRRPVFLSAMVAAGVLFYSTVIYPQVGTWKGDWTFQKVEPSQTGIQSSYGTVYDRLDPRIQHVAKWLLSMADSVAVGDFEGTGKPGLFFGNPLKQDAERGALYRNLGGFRFERVRVPALEERAAHPETYGLPTQGLFVDYNNDGALDLFVSYAFGSPLLLKNMMRETGKLEFKDVTEEVGLKHYTNSVAATFLDVNGDGRLDLIITNVLPTHLADYPEPAPLLNLFKLPEPQYPGDRRMFHFMHNTWNNADNGGMKELWLQDDQGHFVQQDSKKWGLPETRWSMSIGTADFNHDGWPDIYVANDFGPDDLYLNEGGKHFRSIRGKTFGSIGRDTYKGMNVSIGDLDRTGWQDIYISNVHHELQAEGSLLWKLSAGDDPFLPKIVDTATQRGALNERRFGWGGTMADFGNDGWLDIAQTNGMVDDAIDKKYDKCPDYWYTNEKLARSAPSIHSYADNWGDLRGYCIYGSEWDRIYLNRGPDAKPQFIDIAQQVGIEGPGNSRGMAAVDLDNTGRLDLIITHEFRAPTIYRNLKTSATPTRHWIGFDLESDTPGCNRDGMGSQVYISYLEGRKPVTQLREKQAINGMSAQGDRRIHFGLGSFEGTPHVTVHWCGKETEDFRNLQPDQYHKLIRGSAGRVLAKVKNKR